MDLFQNLNDKQAEAVSTTEGYVRVIAGAGSGKTKLLVSRYAYLVRELGIDSANILCVTFTNKAAGEMKRRIRALIGPEYDTTLICTYHGFCARLIRENPEKLFLTKSFQIIDNTQQKMILEDIYQKHELKLDHASFESILKKLGRFKGTTDYVSRMCDPHARQIMEQLETVDDQIMEEFMQRQKAIYALDFHDLLSFALYLLETDTEVREKWQERLNYIMVDEFQDSSKREMTLIDTLSASYENVMIVGDPDQNIYEWRGSDVKLLVDFDKNHGNTQTIFLNRNYRSTPQILKCANALIDKNELRIKKDLYTRSPDGAQVFHYHSKSDAEETAVIADTIKRLVKEEKRPYSDFAILYRSSFLSRVVEKKLAECNLPYEIYGGVKFFQRMEVMDLIAYLRLIAFDDDVSFKRIVNTPRRRFGRSKLAALEALREQEITLFDGEKEPSLFSTLAGHTADSAFRTSGAAGLVSLIREMRDAANRLRISEIVNEVSVRSGYEQYIRELGDEERLENLAEFKRIADEFERSFGEELTLDEFLRQIALQSGEDDDSPKETVKLMTIHSSKGLEFPVVFLVGFTEGIFPSSKTIEERKRAGLEEERRLCYVAITRAEKRLYLMDSEGTSQNGIKKLPSRFLDEIGTENYTRIGVIDEDLQKESRAYIRKTELPLVSESDKQTGETVEHPVFGKGTIIGRDEKRGSYIIQFERLTKPRTLSKDFFTQPHSAPSLPKNENAPTSAQEPHTEQTSKEEAPQKTEKTTEKAPLTTPAEEPCRRDAKAVGEAPPAKSEENEVPPNDLTDEEKAALQKKLAETENLWRREDVPHDGWYCTGITDLGAPVGVCEMCGYQIIRYVHHMIHPSYRPLGVGCVCAGKMEGDVAAARKRERDFKNRQSRLAAFRKKVWKTSKNGNPYLKVKERVIVLYQRKQDRTWKYAIDNVFSVGVYSTREKAIDAVFDALNP